MPDPQPSFAIRIVYWLYRSILSPVLHAFSPAQCLYLPTCSEYAYVALVRFGVFKGSWLALRRLARCHPFSKGGLDPVPAGNPEAGNSGAGNSAIAPSVTIPTDHLP
jgi:putative membrane protein insertion efficiency factor